MNLSNSNQFRTYNSRIICVESRRKLSVNGQIIIDLRDGSTRIVNSRGLSIGGVR